MRKLFREKKNGKVTNDFYIAFNDLKYGKSSLFCCNSYRHALFKILFLWISSRYLRKALTKEKREEKSFNDPFIALLLHLYDLNYLNSTKSRLSNQKSGMVLQVTLIQNSKMDIVTKFQVSIFKNDEVRGGKVSSTWNRVKQYLLNTNHHKHIYKEKSYHKIKRIVHLYYCYKRLDLLKCFKKCFLSLIKWILVKIMLKN